LIDSIDRNISEEFSKRIVGTFGQAGGQWLRKVPRILGDVAVRWSIKLQPPFHPLSYNYVAPAITRNGELVVLKAGVPNRELSTEIDALRHFDGHGAVRLINADPDEGLLLLERLVPGVPVQELPDDDIATSIFARVMRDLHRPPPSGHSFPSASDWARGFQRLRDQCGGDTGPFPGSVIDHAEALMFELIGSMSDAVVLHGDLHHWNILSSKRELWLAIDPKGVIGEPEYEVGAWLRNPYPQILKVSKQKEIMARRVDQLVDEFGFDRSRIIGWAFSQAVLAGVWSFEEGMEDWDGWLALADNMAALL
jgi:streptomycin 6-kinase